MPRFATKRKRSSKHVFSRKKAFRSKRSSFKRRTRTSTSIAKGPTGFADRIFVKLRCCETFDFTFTDWTETMGGLVVGGNTPGDPFQGASTAQCYGFDQWSNYYNWGRCYGSSVRATIIPASIVDSITTGAWAVFHAIVPQVSATVTSTHDLAAEQPYAKYKIARTYDAPSSEVHNYMSTAKMWGVDKKNVMREDNWRFALGSATNPTNVWYQHYVLGNISGGSGTTDQEYRCIVRVTYYCELFGRKELGVS